MNIIQINAPTSDKLDVKVKEFYTNLEEAICLTINNKIIIVITDFNAKIGLSEDGEVICKYGLGERNTSWDILVQFCN